MQSKITDILQDAVSSKQRLLGHTEPIERSARLLIDALAAGRKVLVCGNGGSAADAQHMAGELVGRFQKDRPGLPCLALTTDSSIVTACANDFGYEAVFARQVEAMGAAGDVLVGITTSGNSANVVKAFEAAAGAGMKRVALTGNDGGRVATMDGVLSIVVPSCSTQRIQEGHITVIHVLCELVEDALFGNRPSSHP
ncbi:MAG: D-sedoheptulose 7-phosphate isomerase [Candidatus Tectomicrobia bacterium]|nr:D-sedoheptulose 7-phosphate isomerase [Candidatus Tectomicrobia bacterium]